MKYLKIILLVLAPIFVGNTSLHAQSKSNFTSTTIWVNGNCEMCKKTIESSLNVKGIKQAEWNTDSKKLEVVFNSEKITIDRIHELIANVGYETDKLSSNEAAYKNLPDCCQYTRTKK
jgi:copper chaperone CopZ